MFLTRISVAYPVFAAMVTVAITIFGVLAYQRIPIAEFPEVDFPIVAIDTRYQGASPEAAEIELSQPIEKALNTLSGIERISSTSRYGRSSVVVEFALGIDSMQAAQEVRDRLATIAGTLPATADDPVIMRYDPLAAPDISLALSSPNHSIAELTRLAEDTIVPRLTALDGVGSAEVLGGLEDQVQILVDPALLDAHGISIGEVVAALGQDNHIVPAGTINQGLLVHTVQVNSERTSVEAFADVILAQQGDAFVRLGDVATVRRQTSDIEGLAFRDGTQSLALDVIKVQGGNTINVVEHVLHAVDILAADGTLPPGVSVSVLQNAATAVEQNYHSVRSTLLEGGALAIVIVFLFLNSWRSTVITGLTLPISVIGTLTVIELLGFSLNMMTMLALTLSIGILIDDAIVVRENIARHLHMGKSHRRAALEGTAEIGLAVLATTLSIIAVFLPLAFMDGIIGRFFIQFGVTVSVAVLISLFVSFTLDPMLSSIWHDPHSQPGARRGPIGRTIARFDQAFAALTGFYRHTIGWSLRHRIITLVVAFGTLGPAVMLLPQVGFEFMPQTDQGRISVTLETAIGSSVTYTAEKTLQVERLVAGMPGVVSTYATVNSGGATGENRASILVTLSPSYERVLSATDMSNVMRTALVRIPGVIATVNVDGGVGGGGKAIEMSMIGLDLDELDRLSQDLVTRIAAIPGTLDVASSFAVARPALDVNIDREAATDLGVAPQQIGAAVSAMVGGETASEWTAENGQRIDVVVRLPEQLRSSTRSLDDLPVARAQDGRMIRLHEVATLAPVEGPGEIHREALMRQVTIDANVSDRVMGDVVADIEAAIAAMDLPASYSVTMSGDAELLDETVAGIAGALGLAAVLIYLVLASQFGHLLQPVAIMAAMPLALIGVILGLYVGGTTLNIYSMIGFVMLMGLVVKNAILLVDNFNQRRREGIALEDALVEAGTTRFRPIIMTTLAMIIGMMPLALAIHPGSEASAGMAHAVIGGLVSSTLLTLLVVPVLIAYLEQLSQFVARFMPRAPDEASHEDSRHAM
jgi:HAE1 family hydrophobic/amphiphilic exporter-1